MSERIKKRQSVLTAAGKIRRLQVNNLYLYNTFIMMITWLGVFYSTSPEMVQKRRVKMGMLKNWLVVVCALFVVLGAISPSFAASDNTLFTEEQVYNNLVPNAGFESWSLGTGASTSVPDGWVKVGVPTKYDKITADKRIGSASAKITASAIGDGLNQALTFEPNTTYTVGFYYKTTTGTFAFTITGTTPPSLTGNTALSAASWAYKSWTFTTDSDDTSLTLNFKSEAATDVFSLDGVMVTRGPLAPAFSDKAITDIGNQTIYGDITIQDTDSANYIILDKDTGTITASGTISATADNAQLLDSIDSTQFLRSDISDSVTTGATLNINSGAALSIDGAWDIAGTQVTPTAVEMNILAGGISASEIDGTLLTTTEGDAAYVNEGQANSITSAMITNAEIVDADISASAAIVDTKLAQITTANKVADSALSSNIVLKNGLNTFTAATASPVLIKPSSAPTANTKLLDMQATGAGVTNFSIDAEGDIVANSLDLATLLPDSELAVISTAGKVSGAALTLLANTPAGAGIIPAANTVLGASIDSAEIVDLTIATGDIADSAITSLKIAADTIAAADIATGAVETTEILDGTIANVDVSLTAAIAGTKISPDFGSQNVITTGYIRQLRTIYFIPAYENSLTRPDGSLNRGTLKTTYSSTDNHSYYEWTTNEPVAQDYDIVVRVKLPDGFSSFDATTPIKLYTKSSEYADANTKVVVQMKDSGGNAVLLSGAASVTLRGATTTGAWYEDTITIGTPTVAFASGQWVTFILTLNANQNDTIDVGELSLKGNW